MEEGQKVQTKAKRNLELKSELKSEDQSDLVFKSGETRQKKGKKITDETDTGFPLSE